MTAAGWLEEAACRDKPLEWFFPVDGGTDATNRGRACCAVCPVVAECELEHQKAERETGMALPGLWAGKTSRDRKDRRPRRDERRAFVGECVVCGGPVHDRGYGIIPRYCTPIGGCAQRANHRRRRGAPESDAEYALWKQSQDGCRVPQPTSEKVGA